MTRQRGRRRGFALSVFRSPRISRFDVELLGDLPDGGLAGTNLLVARAFGPIIDKIGGVPFGASGSPVYVKNVLIGAISSVLSSDFKHVGITPIGDMVRMQREPYLCSTAISRRATTSASHHVLPVGAGFRSMRAAEQIRRRFGKDAYINPHGTSLRRQSAALQAGSPVGVALLTGDLQLGFVGTTTTVEQSRVLAFGHPLLFAGPVRMPLTQASIIATGGGTFPAKIGLLGETIGTVLQDRAAGVFGVLSEAPENLVDLDMQVQDGDRVVTEHTKARAVPIPAELPFLVFVTALETIIRAMNRVGSGYGSWMWRVHFTEDEPLEMSEEVFSPTDIAFAIAVSVFPLIEEALAEGRHITGVELDANVRMK